jgi:hypothetical protein
MLLVIKIMKHVLKMYGEVDMEVSLVLKFSSAWELVVTFKHRW